MNRLVVIFLESAELRVQERRDLTMEYWRGNINRLQELNEQPLLAGAGSGSNAAMESRVTDIYGSFDARRKEEDKLLADSVDLQEIIAVERQMKNRK